MFDTDVAMPQAVISRNTPNGKLIERFSFQTEAEIKQLLVDVTATFQV